MARSFAPILYDSDWNNVKQSASLKTLKQDIELCLVDVLCPWLRLYNTWIQEQVPGAWIKGLWPVREGFVVAMH